MKNIKTKLAWILMVSLLLINIMPLTAWADDADPTWKDALESTDEYLKENSGNDAWSVFARGRNLDADHTEDYYINYYDSIDVEALSSAGDCAKTLLALNAEGRGKSEKAEKLREKLLDWENNNAWLTESPYSVPVIIESLSGELSKTENKDEKEGLITSIDQAITKRYDLYGFGIDVDSTAMAAASLTTVDGHQAKIEGILGWLKELQDTDGNISGAWGKSPETTAQAIVVLSELNKTDDLNYTKAENTTIDGLMTFYDKTKTSDGGGFTVTEGLNPVIRAQQANYALVAYERSIADDAASLFDFSDVKAVYYFSFDGNGASNSMHTQAIEEGDTGNLNANTLIRNGYRFLCWKDAEGNTYTNKQAVTASKDIVLFAVWERIVTNSSDEDEHKYINLNPYYEEIMRVKSPYAVIGDWRLNDAGKWTFFIDGQQVKGRWVTAINPAAGRNKAGWFYFDEKGEMLTGWQKIKDADGIERWYYLNPHPDPWYGACFRNTITPDGYVVDENGVWLDPNNVAQEEISKITEKVMSEETASDSSNGTESGDESKNEKKIYVSVSVSGNTISGSEEVMLNKNASAYDALKALAKSSGWTVSGSGSYVKGIGGEMEKSAGALSGWSYSVNGDTPNKSAGSYKLKDGDSVDWTFVDGPDY